MADNKGSDDSSAAPEGENQKPDSEPLNWGDVDDGQLHEAIRQEGEWDANAREEERMQESEDEERARAWRLEKSIAKRSKLLWDDGLLRYPDVKGKDAVPSGRSDPNRIVWLNTMFGGNVYKMPPKEIMEGPYFDTFHGAVVNHKGEVIKKDSGSVELMMAMSAGGMQDLQLPSVTRCVLQWAATREANMITEKVRDSTPQWDGKRRLRRALVTLLKSKDDKYHEDISQYFFLSFYCRMMWPGCYAPMWLALIGKQFVGKTRFIDIISEMVLWENAVAADVDFGKLKDFLRSMPGLAVMALVGEMKGINNAGFEAVKSFVTRTADNFDQKYRDNYMLPRQWVAVIDGNKSDGLLRDDTGNRRFIPFHVGYKGVGADGQYEMMTPDEFKVDLDLFRSEFWHIMAECREWMAEHGMDGYIAFVNRLVMDVFAVCEEDRRMNRGTQKDDRVETYLKRAMLDGYRDVVAFHRKETHERMVAIPKATITFIFTNKYKFSPHSHAVNNAMTAMGFTIEPFSAARTTHYIIKLKRLLKLLNHRDDEVVRQAVSVLFKASLKEMRNNIGRDGQPFMKGKTLKGYSPTPAAVVRLWMATFGGRIGVSEEDGSVIVEHDEKAKDGDF